MNVLITGGGGFLGQRLASELLEHGGLLQGKLNKLMLVDKVFPGERFRDPRAEYIEADFANKAVIDEVIGRRPKLIFHLAAIVSGEAEKNLDLGMQVNFRASAHLLEQCRFLEFSPRIVFTSSVAVYGGDVDKVITDETAARPRNSYGTQKAMVDLLLNDYSRRGYVDARSLRLPTIAIRPGKPNAATSSFVSSIIREPLNGKKATFPVPLDTQVWIQSPKRVVQNFVHAANIDEKLLGNDRIINLPGLTSSIREMIDSLATIAPEAVKLVSYEPDEFLQNIVLTFPRNFNTRRALDLQFVSDRSAEEIIQSYMEEEGISYPS